MLINCYRISAPLCLENIQPNSPNLFFILCFPPPPKENIAGTFRILILISQKIWIQTFRDFSSARYFQSYTEIRLQSTQLSLCIYQERLSCALFGFLFLIKVSHCSINFLSEKFHCTGKDNLPWQFQEIYSCYSSERNLFFFTM